MHRRQFQSLPKWHHIPLEDLPVFWNFEVFIVISMHFKNLIVVEQIVSGYVSSCIVGFCILPNAHAVCILLVCCCVVSVVSFI